MGSKVSDHVVVYEPGQRVKMGFFKSWAFMLRNIIESRELIWQLFKRDFFAGYKQSFFGVFWILISPIVGIFAWVFMNSTGILNPGDVGVPYPVFVLIGTTFWGLFLGCYMYTAMSLSSGGALITQVNFSHEALVAQQIAQVIANFTINIAMISLVLLFYGVFPHWPVIFLPLALLPLFFLGTGIGMAVSVISVVMHDVSKMVTAAFNFLMFLTPIVYGTGLPNPTLQAISKWNPLAFLIGGPRDLIIHGRIENVTGYVYSSILALVVFLLSWRFFFVSEYKVAEKL